MVGQGANIGGYAFVVFDANDHVWNVTTQAYEPWSQTLANMQTNYKVTATQLGTSGLFSGTPPTGAVRWFLVQLVTGQLADPISDAMAVSEAGNIVSGGGSVTRPVTIINRPVTIVD